MIVYPLLEGRALGWPAWGWLIVAGGCVLLVVLGVLEARRGETTIAPLLRTPLFRIPAFTAGLAVQLAFSAGLQGFFLIFALWLQVGQGYSPLRAGLTTVAFSVGSFLLAGAAIPLAHRFGRLVLVAGGVVMAVGIFCVDLGAQSMGRSLNPLPILPGLVVTGAGLALLVIPLVNVVLAAVPARAAGAASGLFATVQQVGGAIGVALVGSVFFDRLSGSMFTAAFTGSVPYVVAAFLGAAVLALVLPRTAVADEYGADMSGEPAAA
jgi:hypothetical protein